MVRHRGLFLIPSLRCGGAERVFTLLLNKLAARGFNMHLALCQREGFWLEKLSPEVMVHDLRAPRVRQAAWPLIQLVARLRPQTVLSTSSHFNTLTGLCRRFFPARTRVLLREVSIDHFEPSALKGLRGALTRRGYQSADGVIALTDGMVSTIQQRLHVPADRIVRIYNPLELEATPERTPHHRTSSTKKLLAIGSLTPPKGMDRLIAAFPALVKQHPGSTLTILGEGPDRAALERQVADLGLAGSVHLPGFSPDVRSHLAQADLFVLPSRFEGMPNALLEAISARCPVVVLDHPGGTREVMDLLGEGGRVTETLSSWKAGWFEPLDGSSIELARLHFGLDSIVSQYENALFADREVARRAA